MKNAFLIVLILNFISCVKDESNISSGNNVGTTTGTSNGGEEVGIPGSPDPLADQAWHLKNTGQKSFSDTNGIANHDIKLEFVHNDLNIRGRNIRIAVSDTGVDLGHPDLNDNSLSGEHRNYTSNNSSAWNNADPYPSDDDPHGTAVSGLISALGWNGIGSRGVAPESKFAAFRYIYEYNPATVPASSRLAKKIDQYNGNFDIFNYSYGLAGYVFATTDDLAVEAIKLAATSGRNGKGSIYIQSSGNSFLESYLVCDPDVNPDCEIKATGNANAHEELSSPYKIVVGAVNALGKRSSYSTPGSNLWVSAPGGEDGITKPAMISTDIRGCNAGLSFGKAMLERYFDFGAFSLNPRCDYTARMNGTSSAAPVTSGVVALMLEANPNLTWRDVKHILALTATKVDFSYDPILNTLSHPRLYNIFGYTYDNKWIQNSAGFLFSNWYGFGRINAKEAVSMAMSYNLSSLGIFEQTQNDLGTWFYNSGPINETINDESPIEAQNTIWVGHNYTIEAVQIQITSDHTFPGDLAIHLVSPSGTESRLMTLNNYIYSTALDANFTMATNAFYGEESKGRWTLKIYDGSAGGNGALLNWKILISGHRKSSELLDPYPPTFLSMGPVPSGTTTTPIFSFSDSIFPVSNYEVAIGTSHYDEFVKPWTSIGPGTSGHQVTGLSLITGDRYYLKVRARSGARVSTPQVRSWVAN